MAPTDIGCAFTRFLFLQDLDNLFFSKSLLYMSFLLRSDSTEKWRSFRGSGQMQQPRCHLQKRAAASLAHAYAPDTRRCIDFRTNKTGNDDYPRVSSAKPRTADLTRRQTMATKRQRAECYRPRLAARQPAPCLIRKKNQKKNSSAFAAFFAIYPCF